MTEPSMTETQMDATEVDSAESKGASMADELDAVVEHLNDHHADTVTFIARHVAGEQAGVTTAALHEIAANGLTFQVATPALSSTLLAFPFEEGVSSIEEIRTNLFSLLGQARAASPDAPLTSLEEEFAAGSAYQTFVTEVVAVEDVGPHLRQISFAGGLDGYERIGGDEFLFVFVPGASGALNVDAEFSWEENETRAEDDRAAGAYYSVRHWDPDARRLDFWFVLHDHDGPASSWAKRAQPGDVAALWGPRQTFLPDPAFAHYVMAVDDAGLGAAAALIDQILDGNDARVTLIAEVAAIDDVVDLPSHPSVEVQWQFRGDTEPGTAGLLEAAVRATELDDPARTAVFAAAESREVSAIRRFVRETWDIPAERSSLTGYWRR